MSSRSALKLGMNSHKCFNNIEKRQTMFCYIHNKQLILVQDDGYTI